MQCNRNNTKMKFQTIITSLAIAASAPLTSAAPAAETKMAMTPRAADPIMGPATCGSNSLPHDDLVKRVEEFAAWVERGADGQVDAAGKFHYRLHVSTYNEQPLDP